MPDSSSGHPPTVVQSLGKVQDGVCVGGGGGVI